MNFFEAQDQARRNTLLLVVLFAAAVAATIGVVYFIFRGVFAMSAVPPPDAPTAIPDTDQIFTLDIGTLITSSIIVLTLVSLGSLYKIIVLSGGGASIAESMGGRLVLQSTHDSGERRLLNIVEEMAIAAGAPMPGVYLLPDGNINAFAAGTTPSNAVIGVTRGAMKHLSREQMQGVMAHEFSHIMNGDMRLNLRLIAIIHGIMLLGYLGYFIIRGAFFATGMKLTDNRRVGAQLVLLPVIGFTLVIAGFVGTFFGSLIRASISRQREYLADAAAVQYTRQPLGIAGALERIGQLSGGIKEGYQNEQTDAYQKRLAVVAMMQMESKSEQDPHTIEYSHMFFSNAVAQGLSQPFATHPPLKDRISRLMPGWSEDALINTSPAIPVGNYEPEKPYVPAAVPPPVAGKPSHQRATAAYSSLFGASSTANIAAAAVVGQLGTINIAAIKRANAMTERIPPALARATEEPYAARALIYALLMDKKHDDIRTRQMAHLQEHADTGVYDLTAALLPEINSLPPAARLPLVQIALPTLRLLSRQQYELFLSNMGALISADEAIELFEWCLQAIIVHTLHDHFSSGRRARPRTPKDEAMAYALSILSRVGQEHPAQAFAGAMQKANLQLAFTERDFNPQELYDSMQAIALLLPKRKQKFAQAAVYCAAHNNRIDPNEAALLRAYFMIMDCPMPLLLADGEEG